MSLIQDRAVGSTKLFTAISPFKMGRGGHWAREMAQWVQMFSTQTPGPELESPVPTEMLAGWVVTYNPST